MMGSPHVVLLTNNVVDDKMGGLERYVSELATTMTDLGARVTLIAKRRHPDSPVDSTTDAGVRVIRHAIPQKDSRSFAVRYVPDTLAGVSRAMELAGPADVVHAHFPVPALLPAMRRRRFVYTLHAPVWRELLAERQDSYYLPKPVRTVAQRSLRRVERTIVRRASHILTLSAFMRREVSVLDGAAGQRVQILPGGIDTARFDLPQDPFEAPGAPALFTARRLVPRTGVQELVRAMPAVRRALPGAVLSIAGDGPQRDALVREISRENLEDAVRLLGRLSDDALVRAYQVADLAITPSQELEGFGLSTAEALACGTAGLVTPIGANPEVVAPLDPRLVTDDASTAALARGIIGWFADGRAPGTTTAADTYRAVVHPAMSWAEVAARHLEVYERHLADDR